MVKAMEANTTPYRHVTLSPMHSATVASAIPVGAPFTTALAMGSGIIGGVLGRL